MARKKKDTPVNNPEAAPEIPPESPDTISDAALSDDDEDGAEVNAADAAQSAATSNVRLKEMMNQNFIEYASYVIKDRAIPDVDDGLKPVQRRILWAMDLTDDGSFHKVAGVIGDTMKFHPHGDASIYGALVYLANKELFIDRQGNYGSIITGKSAAAPRYIECRLTALAREVLFNKDITELVDSYDGRNVEPVVLPAKIPNLLIMGADGIAVGTNTKIMPHNFNEVLQAQIAYLKGEPFTLYPDFLQGGIMDVSKYEDGLGKIVVRAKLEIDGRSIVIQEIPATTDTEKLMDSIENAVNRNKIKIASFHDYTAKDVDIHLVPIRGTDPEKVLNALYAYTNCQLSISCNPLVIQNNHPRRMPVSDILRHNTDMLVKYLTWELQQEQGRCLEKIFARTLEQIFIGEGIYKRIEKCRSKDAMFREVRAGLEKFRSEWLPVIQALHENILAGPRVMPLSKDAADRLDQLAQGIVPDPEIARLVEIPIRRISAFEMDENRTQIEIQKKALDEAEKNLKRIKAYTVKYLQSLIDRYGGLFPRHTEICLDGFEKIDKSAVALNNIRVGWDKKNCYIGTGVKSDDIVVCNEFDHLLCIERAGSYRIINIPEKIFIDRLFEFRKYDRSTEFGIVYSDKKTGRVYAKRSVIDKFITDREYRIIPDGCRLEMITPRPNAVYEIRVDTPIRARQTQEINLTDFPLRSPKAGGSPVSQKKLLKITFLRYLDGSEGAAEPALIEVPPDAPEKTVEPEISEKSDLPEKPDKADKTSKVDKADKANKAYKTNKKSAPASNNADKKPAPASDGTDKQSTDAPAADGEEKPEEEETWGIQPDLLGF